VIEIVRPGIATTFQDAGRPGLAHLGVGEAGAVDHALIGLVNRLVGNGSSTVAIETCGDLELVVDEPTMMATSVELAPVIVEPGRTLRVRSGANGRLWQYVAVRGGFVVAPVLGSASTDTLADLGPPPLAAGQRITVGEFATGASDSLAVVDVAPLHELDTVARVYPGPRRDWFTDASWHDLTSSTWSVTTTSRVGVRLTGGRIERAVATELPSEGLVRGAIQVPPDGDPVMMSADHPTTGGYPVIAVVHPDDVTIVAQRPAGTSIRFRRYG
jgi:biotin-dependent carboxylase-like uncharacterized protein